MGPVKIGVLRTKRQSCRVSAQQEEVLTDYGTSERAQSEDRDSESSLRWIEHVANDPARVRQRRGTEETSEKSTDLCVRIKLSATVGARKEVESNECSRVKLTRRVSIFSARAHPMLKRTKGR